MKTRLRAWAEVIGGVLIGTAVLALLFFPVILWPLAGALSISMIRTPHLFAALLSLPPLLCLIPLLRMLPACWRSVGGARRALLAGLAVPAIACWLLAFAGSLVMAPFQLGWRPLPYLVLAAGFYGCAIPLSRMLCAVYDENRGGGRLSTLGMAARMSLVLLLLLSALSYPVAGHRAWVSETENGPVVHVWLALDGGSSGSLSAPGYEPEGPLLYGTRILTE